MALGRGEGANMIKRKWSSFSLHDLHVTGNGRIRTQSVQGRRQYGSSTVILPGGCNEDPALYTSPLSDIWLQPSSAAYMEIKELRYVSGSEQEDPLGRTDMPTGYK